MEVDCGCKKYKIRIDMKWISLVMVIGAESYLKVSELPGKVIKNTNFQLTAPKDLGDEIWK